jgi:hypothetical protein
MLSHRALLEGDVLAAMRAEVGQLVNQAAAMGTGLSVVKDIRVFVRIVGFLGIVQTRVIFDVVDSHDFPVF